MQIDKTLKAIVMDCNCKDGCNYCRDWPNTLEQIKAAFTEAGYIQVPTVNKVDDKLYIYNGMDKRVYFDGTDKQLMTGQEWYDRFEKEYNKFEGQKGGGTIAPRTNAIIAARRAARIEGEK